MNIYMSEAEKKDKNDSHQLSVWFTEEILLQNTKSKQDILLNIKDVHEAGI